MPKRSPKPVSDPNDIEVYPTVDAAHQRRADRPEAGMMPAFSDNLLIHPDGSTNESYLLGAAHRIARQRYGADCTKADVAYYIEDLTGRALIMRARKLRELGLAADPTVSIEAYGKPRTGVRMSAF